MSIEFKGIEGIEKKLSVLEDFDALEKALKDCCLLVERSAKQKVQKFRDTGNLARSIESKVENMEGIVHTPLEYAPYVEYGTGLFAEEEGRKDVPWCYQDDKGEWHTTSGQHPQPYMRPALNENREKIIRILKGALLDG